MRANGPAAEARHSVDICGGTVIDIDETGVFLSLDVDKSNHHRHGLTAAGKKVFDKALPNGEPQLRAVFDKLKAKFGTVLVYERRTDTSEAVIRWSMIALMNRRLATRRHRLAEMPAA